MPASQALIAHNVTLQFGSLNAEITDIQGWGASREAIDVTHMTSPNYWKEMAPSPYRAPLEVTVTCAITNSINPMTLINGNISTLVITLPPPDGFSVGAQFSCSAFVSNVNHTASVGQKMTVSITFVLTGQPTFTGANLMLSREEILAANDSSVMELEVPEWNGMVYIRSLTAGERERLEQSIQGYKTNSSGPSVRAIAACLCLADEKGKPLFNYPADAALLSNKNGAVLDRIFDAIVEHNGLTKEATKEDKKKLVPTTRFLLSLAQATGSSLSELRNMNNDELRLWIAECHDKPLLLERLEYYLAMIACIISNAMRSASDQPRQIKDFLLFRDESSDDDIPTKVETLLRGIADGSHWVA